MRFVTTCTSAAVALLAAGGCIASDSPLLDGTEGCEEFEPGAAIDGELDVDGTVLDFMRAAADLSGIALEARDEVLEACASVATDLGAADTWSGLEDIDDRISNADGSGACDAATHGITDLLVEAEQVDATVAVMVSRGECRIDFDEQAKCDAECAGAGSCDSGSAEERCEPGELSVVCEGSCELDAYCVGSPERPANCMGECQSTCVGQCQGKCVGKDGEVSYDDPNCVGKCAAACNGECRGRCKVAEPGGIECGADVRCTGGCSGTYGDPQCVTEYAPPSCEVDAECHAACSARVAANADCDPPHVVVAVNIADNPKLAPLVATLEANLPPLIRVAQTQGPLAADASERLAATGSELADSIAELDGRSLACLGAASTAIIKAVSSLRIAIAASVSVSVTVDEHTE